MYSIFENEEKIEQFEKLQMDLNNLEPNTDDDQIKEILRQIPTELLNQKEDLMIICEIFAIHARNKHKTKKRNIFKLFEGIMANINTFLKNESWFFWNISGGLYFLKLWMYEKGLISIETIILAAKKDINHAIAEYFLPEIIEKEPEMFEKEIKHKIKCSYSPEYIQSFIETRKKYIKWICESGDYRDPFYREIEPDPLLYSIATDDVDSFQRIISNLNLDINSKIKESLIQNSHRLYKEQSIFELALEYNAINITKFLIMNNVEFHSGLYFSAICSNNYEMIHLLETKLPNGFDDNMIYYSISTWNDEVTEYLLNKYEDSFGFLDQSDTEIERTDIIFDVIEATINYLNFHFLNTYLIPFLRRNSRFVDKHINDIINLSFYEKSCFFTNEFIKNPNFDVNYYSKSKKYSILGNAIDDENLNAVEILLKNPDIDLNGPAFNMFLPLMFAVGNYSDIKIIDLICKHQKTDIKLRDRNYNVNSFELSVSKGNLYSLQYLIDNYPDCLETNSYPCLFNFALKNRNLKTLEILLKFYLSKSEKLDYETLVKTIKSFAFDAEFHEEYLNDFKIIYDELVNK